MTVSEQLRRELEKATRRQTLYTIAKESGVSWRVLQRFLTGERPELRTGTVDRLCEYFGLELSRKRKSRR
jgi:hypothetical protein